MREPSASGYAVVIPAYNEAATIHDVAARALRHVSLVIVVDDGSRDGTASALDNLPVTVLRHQHNRGKAAALWRGMEHALGKGAAAIITLDGDGQHEPEDIPRLIAIHRRYPRSIVIGSRTRCAQSIPRLRYYANQVANFWIGWAAGQPVLDSQSGFRLYPAEVLRSLTVGHDDDAGFVFESEILIEAGRNGMKSVEVPVTVVYGSHLRRSHFRQVKDIALIVRMVAKKLLARRMDLPGLMRSLKKPADAEAHGADAPGDGLLPTIQRHRRRRILFVAEAVTLAHVARAIVLARAVDPAEYDVHLACDPRYLHLFGELPFAVHPIRSISSEHFQDLLSKGKPLYDVETLRAYVKDDLDLLATLSPQRVIGDFRLSLTVSARVVGIPYIAVTNAHWSPYARPRYLVPELALTDKMGSGLGQAIFDLMRPFLFAYHAFPFNRVRREYGLPHLGHSLPHIFTDGDETLYADLPELVPSFHRPIRHRYLGPILWSPTRTPSWWNDLPKEEPMVYVNLGTSGKGDLLPVVIDAVADLGLPVFAATAGRAPARPIRARAWVTDYLPGVEAAKRADVVICNGGSAAVYQALAAGTPVLGLPINLDQYLTMFYVQKAGVGELVRAGEASAHRIQTTVRRLLAPVFRRRAEQMKAHIDVCKAEDRFVECLAEEFAHEPEPVRNGAFFDLNVAQESSKNGVDTAKLT